VYLPILCRLISSIQLLLLLLLLLLLVLVLLVSVLLLHSSFVITLRYQCTKSREK
jgi:hypothetical protein